MRWQTEVRPLPWLLIAQIILLVLWYTAAPAMPVWLVFLPGILFGGVLFVLMCLLAFAFVVEVQAQKS